MGDTPVDLDLARDPGRHHRRDVRLRHQLLRRDPQGAAAAAGARRGRWHRPARDHHAHGAQAVLSPSMSLISAEELLERIDNPAVVPADVRWWLTDPGKGRSDYEAAHLPGAVFVDLERRPVAATTGPGAIPSPAPAAIFARPPGARSASGRPTRKSAAYDDAGVARVAARLWWMLDGPRVHPVRPPPRRRQRAPGSPRAARSRPRRSPPARRGRLTAARPPGPARSIASSPRLPGGPDRRDPRSTLAPRSAIAARSSRSTRSPATSPEPAEPSRSGRATSGPDGRFLSARGAARSACHRPWHGEPGVVSWSCPAVSGVTACLRRRSPPRVAGQPDRDRSTPARTATGPAAGVAGRHRRGPVLTGL